jgi:TPR repeat protein
MCLKYEFIKCVLHKRTAPGRCEQQLCQEENGVRETNRCETLILGIFLLSASSTVHAFDCRIVGTRVGDFDGKEITDYLNSGKSFTALKYAADQGHLVAQWKVGRMYAAGDGVAQDDQRAFTYFSQIANTHADEPPRTAQAPFVADAFVALGHYYLKGIPNTAIVPDATRAREMFSYAASHFGNTDAQYQLGRLYLDSTPSDPRQAARWFQLAATKGDCRAEAVLGDMLFQGKHVPRQAARGLMLLTLGRHCARTEDTWIKPLYDDAYRRASDDERARALDYLEDWLKGRGECSLAQPVSSGAAATDAH